MPEHKKSNGRPRRRDGYISRSPAICVVVHDPTGSPLPDSVATEIVDAVNEISLSHGLLLSYTKT